MNFDHLVNGGIWLANMKNILDLSEYLVCSILAIPSHENDTVKILRIFECGVPVGNE